MNIPKALFAVLLFAGLSLPSFVRAATLSFSPSYATVTVGQTVTVNVAVSSPGQAMNASSGVVSFPTDKLQVVSIGKTGSIVSFWIQEPSFSNTAGTVSFEGVIPNPGFTGSSAKMLSITFRSISEGAANVSYSAGSVLANDGEGTELLTGSSGATITVQSAAPAASVEAPTAPAVITGEVSISSPTHPDQTKWYAKSSPQFIWTLPPGTLEARTIISTNQSAVPNVSYIPAISSKTASDQPDGTAYFGLRVRTKNGWSAASHYTVNIDTVAPNPFIVSILPYDVQKGVQAKFSTTDDLSGIDYYDLVVNGTSVGHVAQSEASGAVPIPSSTVGTSTLTVVAYDKAGNSIPESALFAIPAPLAKTSNSNFLSILWIVINYFSAFLLLLGMLGGLIFILWYLWHKTRRTTSAHVVAADHRVLHAELIEIHRQLRDEVEQLQTEATARELTFEEKRILKRFSKLAERAQRIMMEEFSKERR